MGNRRVEKLGSIARFVYRAGHVVLLPLSMLTMAVTRFVMLPALSGQRDMERYGELPVARDPAWLAASGEPVEFSIVVPTYNRRVEVLTCLDSLCRQTTARRGEILVVDNGSDDGTWEALAKWPVRRMKCNRRGAGVARNAGVDAARGRLIVFTDSDCTHGDGWLDRLLDAFEDERVGVVGGGIVAQNMESGAAYFSQDFHVLDNGAFFLGSAYAPPFFASANLAVRREVFEQVQGFDPNLPVGEDADFCWRVLERGKCLRFEPAARVDHMHRSTARGLYTQAVNYGSGRVDLFAKHRGKLGGRWVFSWQHVYRLAVLPWNAVFWAIFGRSGFERRAAVYYAIWLTGLTVGSVRQSWRRRVIFV